MLARQDFRQFIIGLGRKFQEFHQSAGAALRIGRCPRRLRRLGVFDRPAQFRLRGERHFPPQRAIQRLKHIGGAAGTALDVLSANKMPIVNH